MTQPGDTLRIRVKPNARVSTLTRDEDGGWIAQLKSPPVDGKANAELIGLVARALDVPKAAVEIRSGAASRLKTVRIRRG